MFLDRFFTNLERRRAKKAGQRTTSARMVAWDMLSYLNYPFLSRQIKEGKYPNGYDHRTPPIGVQLTDAQELLFVDNAAAAIEAELQNALASGNDHIVVDSRSTFLEKACQLAGFPQANLPDNYAWHVYRDRMYCHWGAWHLQPYKVRLEWYRPE